MERFDRGAAIEHVAFVFLVVTAFMLLAVSRIDLFSRSFVAAKFWIGAFVILSMKAFDIDLSPMGGNKALIHSTGDEARYERMMDLHWIFSRVTSRSSSSRRCARSRSPSERKVLDSH